LAEPTTSSGPCASTPPLLFIAPVSLVYWIYKSYEQWLWRELKSHIVAFRDIDAAFSAINNPLTFTHPEMLKRAKITSVLAFVGWFIPISSFIAPATLNIHQVLRDTTHQRNAPTLDIPQANAYTTFAYAVNGTTATAQKYLGPRTIITRIAVAAATTGQTLSLPQPATNASYEQTFFGPYVQCENSTSEEQDQMNGMIARYNQSLGSSIELKSLDYFASVLALSNADPNVMQISNLSDVDCATHASNQLWIFFTRYAPSFDFSRPNSRHYLTCDLYNASYTTRFTWKNGIQNPEGVERSLLGPVAYPTNASTEADSEDAMSYSAVM
jgi:hypothetical protein